MPYRQHSTVFRMSNLGKANKMSSGDEVNYINLRGMIQLNQVEDLLSQILNKIQIQEKEIHHLKEMIPQYAVANHVDKNIEDIHKAIRLLHNRMDVLRDASTIRSSDRIITSAELASQNKERLDKLTKQLDIYADNSIIQDQFTSLIKKYDEIIQSIQENYTPYHLTQSLQRSTANYLTNIQRLEEIISTKIDRSEIRHIEYLYQELEGYHEKIHKLESGYKTLIKDLEDLSEQTFDDSKKLKENLERYISKVEKEFKIADEKILIKFSSLQQEFNSFQLDVQDTYTPLSEQLKNLSTLKEFDSSLSTLHKKTESNTMKINELHTELQSKANHQDMIRGYVKKDAFTELMKSLGEEVDRKSTIEEMRRQENEIQNIYNNLTSHDSQIQVAMRFINWFTHRGELYDYNIKVIDKHLSKLASSSISPQTPHQFQDFSDDITFLPKYRSKGVIPPHDRR